MNLTQLEFYWKALLVILTVAQTVSAAGYVIGRWQQKQEGADGSQAANIKRLDREVGALREWRHEVAEEETKDLSALYRGFVTREEFSNFASERRDETTRLWAEVNRLRNGKH